MLSLDELRTLATDRLARYKPPRGPEVVPALPRNPAGKVLKFEPREHFDAAAWPVG